MFLCKTIHPGNWAEYDKVHYKFCFLPLLRKKKIRYTLQCMFLYFWGVIVMAANTTGYITYNIYCKEDNKQKCKSFPSISKTLVLTDFLIHSESVIPEELEDSSV